MTEPLQDQSINDDSVRHRTLESGIFTISLDFELYWGVRDKRRIEDYRSHLEGVWEAIPRLLQLFEEREIHATWATVGMLFCKDTQSLKASLPSIKPTYSEGNFSPYDYIAGEGELSHDHHFAPRLIELIAATKGQAVGSHTFSHFYTLEAGQSVEAFRHDMITAIDVAGSVGLDTDSLVFPRNQYAPEYLEVLTELGIRAFRGNPRGTIYRACAENELALWRRGLRLLDSYVNISGPNLTDLRQAAESQPYNLAGSFFLRPYADRLRKLDGLKLRRLTAAMTEAAKRQQIFHLWWHPHNFGQHMAKNLVLLEKVLDHYAELGERYAMTSLNMEELADCCDSLRGVKASDSEVGFGSMRRQTGLSGERINSGV